MGMAFHAETGKEINTFHMNALFEHYFSSEKWIEAARNQGDGFALLRHDKSELKQTNSRVFYQENKPDAEFADEV